MQALRQALTDAGYTYDAVVGLLGPTAHGALSRNETTPGLRVTRGGSALETLTRLWPLQSRVPAAAAENALPGLVEALCQAGVLERSDGEVRARVDVRPYADEDHDWWVVSDLTPGLDGAGVRVSGDHVLGISPASTSLAQLTVRAPAARALDLGTGCGVQSVHLSTHCSEIVATDVNERALAMTRLNAALNKAALNGAELDVRSGSLFEPVAGELFDLVVSNPPFVISPGTGKRLVYRDSGLPGDQVVEHIVTRAPRHLTEGGWCQVLANWSITTEQPWEERLSGWLEGSGCDAWVVQREVVDPAQYVELWLKDAGLHGSAQHVEQYVERYDAWLSWFAESGVEAVGFGWLNLHRTEGSAGRDPVLRLEEWPYDVQQPLGAEVEDWGRRTDLVATLSDDQLLGTRLSSRVDVRQESVGAPGAEDPETIVLRQQRGMRRARQVDTLAAAMVGACDGELALGQILDACSHLLGRDPEDTRAAYLPTAREMLTEGFLVPSGTRYRVSAVPSS